MAPPAMSMNKVIHGALRRDLERFRRALEEFPEGDVVRAAGLHRAWRNFEDQLTEHHEGEHAIAWPALSAIGVDSLTIASFDGEHAAMAADLAAASRAMDTLAATAGRHDADAAAVAVTRLQATAVSHLDHEEQETEDALNRNSGHPAMKEMGRQFRRRSSPSEAGTFFVWVQDGASPAELAALRDNVPGPVLAVVGTVFGRRYRREVAPVWAG
ncbi:hemerythrin domain-containing protein [Nocardioides sp. GCM10027113]|uniref:hemerythrin domain-containing protein n=1 Tax=unclassified Nocardioides TaxID=2615069 RepID=UPI0036177802